MRTGEVFALTWNDIDLKNRIIKINKTVYAKDNEKKGRWYLGTTKTVGSCREVFICDTLYLVLSNYKKLQNEYKKEYGKKYKRYSLEEVKNKYSKLVEYRVIESNSNRNRIEMVFTRKDGTYSGTDIVRYPFKIINNELGIKCRFYDLRGSFATSTSPAKNSVLSILLFIAFSFAISIASLTISIPYTFLAYWAINNEIVPIPQYKSKTVSALVIFAISTPKLYNFSACIGFT